MSNDTGFIIISVIVSCLAIIAFIAIIKIIYKSGTNEKIKIGENIVFKKEKSNV